MTSVVILRSYQFFWHPWHPWGRLSSGDIWFELEKSSKSQCEDICLCLTCKYGSVDIGWSICSCSECHMTMYLSQSTRDATKQLDSKWPPDHVGSIYSFGYFFKPVCKWGQHTDNSFDNSPRYSIGCAACNICVWSGYFSLVCTVHAPL